MEMLSCYAHVTHFPPDLTYSKWQFLLDPSGWEVMVRGKHVAWVSCKQQESRELWRTWNVTQDAFWIFTGISVPSEGALPTQKQKCDGESTLPGTTKIAFMSLFFARGQTTSIPHWGTGTHFRLRIKSQMFLSKTTSWRVKCQSLGQSPQMPNKLHISHMRKPVSFSTDFPKVSLCITTHIKTQLMHSPFQKGTQVISTFFFPKRRQMLITGRSSL